MSPRRRTMIADPENPASWLRRFSLSHPVVSCRDAAEAKGVELARELKSLLLTCDDGLVLAHVRGDRRLSLRAVKDRLGSHEARLSGPAELDALGLSPGTIHPFAPAVWPLPHLLAAGVLALPWVTTNAGRHDAYVVFDPLILLRAGRVEVGDFEERD